MSMKNLILSITVILFCSAAKAQDTLPRFTVKKLSETRIAIGWINPFTNIKQISVQRSFDSTKGYKTIISIADPDAVQNGYADTKAPNDHMFYRIFYVLEGGLFYFTAAKKPVVDTTTITETPVITAKPVVPQGFVPSFYVFTNKDGYVQLNLPNAVEKKYGLKFFTEKGELLHELKTVKEPSLILDKANFYSGGWYFFELYDGEKMIEKHKFYLAKDF